MFRFTGILREQVGSMAVDGYVEALLEIRETSLPVLVKETAYTDYLNKTVRANAILSGLSLIVTYMSETTREHDKRCPLVGVITEMEWESMGVAVLTIELPSTNGEASCRCFSEIAHIVMCDYKVGDTVHCKGYFNYVESSSTLIYYIKKVERGE